MVDYTKRNRGTGACARVSNRAMTRVPSAKRLTAMLVFVCAAMVAAKTVMIELQFQYNAHRILMPMRVHPRIPRQPTPVRVLRVSRDGAADSRV